jgi:hypothetical protein
LQRHFCRKEELILSKKKIFSIIIKSPIGLLEDPIISCPVCGKIFKDEISMKNHLNGMKEDDIEHKSFFQNEWVFESNLKRVRSSHLEDNKFQKYPKFGKINIKKVKKE